MMKTGTGHIPEDSSYEFEWEERSPIYLGPFDRQAQPPLRKRTRRL